MTEYDFSPEAYDRYIATQNRISNWVQKTERHRQEFQHAVPTGSAHPTPPPAHTTHHTNHHSTQQHHHHHHSSSSPSPNHHHTTRAQLHITPPPYDDDLSDDDDSVDDSYDDHRRGQMPLRSAPPVMYQHQHQIPQPHIYQPHPVQMHQIMSPPAPLLMPGYLGSPHKSSSSSRKHKSSRSRSHQPSTTSPAYYAVASPPVSPGYQYAYPPMTGGHPGYIMIQPQQQQSRHIPMVPEDIPLPPRSAPPNVPTFTTTPATPQSPSTAQGYFHIPVPGTGGYLVPATSPPLYTSTGGTGPTHQRGTISQPAWSIFASPASTPAPSISLFTPPQSPYYMLPSIPAYQTQSPTPSPAPVPAGYLIPAHQPTYVASQPATPKPASSTGKSSGIRHWFRRSVG